MTTLDNPVSEIKESRDTLDDILSVMHRYQPLAILGCSKLNCRHSSNESSNTSTAQ